MPPPADGTAPPPRPAASDADAAVAEAADRVVGRFTSTPRFRRLADAAFDYVDVDRSGVRGGEGGGVRRRRVAQLTRHRLRGAKTVGCSELLCALLYLNHEVNKLPVAAKLEPPTRDEVARLLAEHHHRPGRPQPPADAGDADAADPGLTRAEFHAAAAAACRDVSLTVARDLFCALVVAPAIGGATKAALSAVAAAACGDRSRPAALARLVRAVPDAVFMPAATAAAAAALPRLLALHGQAAAARRAARRRVGVPPQQQQQQKTEGEGTRGRRIALLRSLVALLMLVALPAALALAWPRAAAAAH